jgi:cytochrome c-type biogenesis protein CcmH
MGLVAIAFAVWPFSRNLQRQAVLVTGLVVFVAGLSAGIYYGTGQPGVPSGASSPTITNDSIPGIEEMVTSLAERLEQEPDDLEGWKMLGRSYMTLGNPSGAVEAYERAVELSDAQDAGALVGLGEALLETSGQTMSQRSISLFENALTIEPNNPAALFWGGIAAFNRGNQALAADRWELLLGTNPPAEIRPMIEQRVAAWRGQPVAQAEASPPPASTQQTGSGAIVAANLSIGDAAASAMPADADVWVIARDPAQPLPPIAVTRRRLSELPMVVELGNRDSMMPGRQLGNFAEFELVVRVSVSGQRTAQPGDWFGSLIVRPAEADSVELSINERIE